MKMNNFFTVGLVSIILLLIYFYNKKKIKTFFFKKKIKSIDLVKVNKIFFPEKNLGDV